VGSGHLGPEGGILSALYRIDPDEGDDQRNDHQKEEKLDPDRQADQPSRAPRTGTAPLAVGGIRNQLRAALLAGDLNLLHILSMPAGVLRRCSPDGPEPLLVIVQFVELQEEMAPADVVLLMSSVPERIGDLVYGLDEQRLRYRHGPAFPTLGGLIGHLLDSGSKVDALLRHAHLDGLSTADVRATIEPAQEEELARPLQEALEDFARVRRRTVDLMHGWGKSEWERKLRDPRGGEITLLDLCRLVARHEIAHIAQIRNLTVLLPEPQDLGPVRPVVE
jgi:hypothetical protein